MALSAVRVTVGNAAPVMIAKASAIDYGTGPSSVTTSVVVQNSDATNSVFLGGPAVTSADGFELKAGKTIEILLDGNDLLYGICAAAVTVVVHVLRQD